MKKIIAVLLALVFVGFYSCKKEDPTPDNNNTTVTPGGGGNGGGQDTISGGGGNGGGQDTTSTPTQQESFVGDWDLMFAEGTNVHLTADFSDIAGYMGMEDIDHELSIAWTSFRVLIAEAGGNQMTVSGSTSMQLMEGMPAVTFDFTTTGTLTEAGLMIEPAPIDNTFEYLQSINIHLTGTITFAQPTAYPVDGELTMVVNTLSVSGSDTSNSFVDVALSGSQMQATGSRVTTGAKR